MGSVSRPARSSSSRRARAFTLVELLVVIGIIAVLISILLPSLQAARRSADRVKCLSSLRQIGNAYFMYSVEYKGYWPMAKFQYKDNAGVTRERRWHDYISKYVLNGVNINDRGDQVTAPQLATIKDGNNVLWGCPTWNRATKVDGTTTVSGSGLGAHNGYAMNFYTFAPRATTQLVAGNQAWAFRGAPLPAAGGWFFKQTQWTKPTERALVFDSVHAIASVTPSWPWWTPATAPMPAYPDAGPTVNMPIDFNRHGRLPSGNKARDPSLNMLFCDGHAANVSCQEAFYAIKFNPAAR